VWQSGAALLFFNLAAGVRTSHVEDQRARWAQAGSCCGLVISAAVVAGLAVWF